MKKKLFSKGKLSKEKLVKFLDKEGFYVVVFLCIAIIATTAVYITRNNMDYFSQGHQNNEVAENIDDHEYFQPEDLEPQEEDQQAVANPDGKEVALEDTAKEEESGKQEENTSTKEIIPNATPVISTNTQDKANENSSTAQTVLSKLVKPVEQNSITMDYSFQTNPVFSVTLDEYRSDHQGIDLAAEKGTAVMAAMDGKVVEIQEDARVGIMVTIDHGNGVTTKYANLDKEVTVTKNQLVKRGQTIGKVANTAMFEIEDEPHVHFEVWKDDKPIDPKTVIKDLKIVKE